MSEDLLATAIRTRLADLVEDDNPRDVAFVRRLIVSFVDRSPGLLTELTTAVTAGDAGTAAHWAHALKGAAANLGADNVAGLCAEVEHRAEAAELDVVLDHPGRLAAELVRAHRQLVRALDSLPTAD